MKSAAILAMLLLCAGCHVEVEKKNYICTDQERAKAEFEAIREIEIRKSSDWGRDEVFNDALARNCKVKQ